MNDDYGTTILLIAWFSIIAAIVLHVCSRIEPKLRYTATIFNGVAIGLFCARLLYQILG